MSFSQGDGYLSCPDAVELGILLPQLAGVVVKGVAVAAGVLCVLARARAGEATCTACGTVSGRVHSRYGRRLADAGIGGRRVVIRLAVRRFFCAAPWCKRTTFAEKVEGLTSRYARRTPPLAASLGGGRGGARRAGRVPAVRRAGHDGRADLDAAAAHGPARRAARDGAGARRRRLRVPPRPRLRHSGGYFMRRRAPMRERPPDQQLAPDLRLASRRYAACRPDRHRHIPRAAACSAPLSSGASLQQYCDDPPPADVVRLLDLR